MQIQQLNLFAVEYPEVEIRDENGYVEIAVDSPELGSQILAWLNSEGLRSFEDWRETQ